MAVDVPYVCQLTETLVSESIYEASLSAVPMRTSMEA